MNRKHSPGDHSMIRCPKARSKLTGEHLTQEVRNKEIWDTFYS